MPDGFTGNFFIQVENATNPTLGQNGQGVCGIRLNFDHEYLGDLSITITSPSGQSVTLVGPIGLWGPTDFTTWDVTFLPCGDPVTPDPGFSNQWNNNQPWGLFGNYTGTYYPFAGCLQNLTGPVNGLWTLTVVDGQAIDVGNFYDYEIIFCDPSGINCFTCAANAGNLTQPDVSACEGSASLNLNLPPTYVSPNTAPPVSEYSYTYVIGGPGGVIQAFEPSPDLSSYPPGTYTVCGMSYLTTDEPDIPAPNGTLTVAQLSTQLNSTQPPFCGKITPNCVNVVIFAAPPDVDETVELCAPSCELFYGLTYCNTGTYVRNLLQNGCPYTATLYLTVNQPSIKILSEVICQGGCSQNPAFPGACGPGAFQATLTNSVGCDSTIFLTLTEMSILANIQQPIPVITCVQPSVVLQGAGSTTGVGTVYHWTASNGGNISGSTTGINATVNAPGDYQLRVCRTLAGTTCCDSTSVTVTANQTPPNPPVITGDNTLCVGQSTTFSLAPVAGASSYTWTVPAGVTITSGQNTQMITVTWGSVNGGNVCAVSNSACGNSTPACLAVTVTAIPVATQPQGPALVCANSTQSYSIPPVSNAASYTWNVAPAGTILSGQGTNQISVNWGSSSSGNVCVTADNSCGSSPQLCLPVTINAIPATPTVSGNTTACAGSSGTYTVSAIAGATNYSWQVTGGTISSGNGTTSIQITWDAAATSGIVCVASDNICGASVQNCLNVILGVPPALPNISGNANICVGTSGTYTIPSVTGANGYTWTVPAGGAIVSGQNTTSITVNWSAAPGGNVCVAANSGCGAGPQDCFPVAVSAQPLANAGVDGAVCGTAFTVSATSSVAGSSGNWSIFSGPGTASFANAGSPSTTITVTQNGPYTFLWTETNSGCVDSDSVDVDFNASPLAGQITPACDGANQNYTISFTVTNGTGPFSIPGGTVIDSSFTSSLVPSGQPYSYVITDANGCASAAVSGLINCNCSTNAGQMSLSAVTTCQGGTLSAQHLGGQNLDANDVFSYVLHSNSGQSLGTVFGQNTNGTFSFQAGMVYGTTYYISYVAGNNLSGFPDPADPCLSVSQGQPVIFYANPVADAGTDAAACGLVIPVSGSGTGAGTWSLVSAPVGGTLNFANAQSSTTDATVTIFGTYTLAWTLNNNGCTGLDNVDLTFNELPSAGAITSACDGANENYSVTIPISGGAAPYSVGGVPVAGASFVSPFLLNGVVYNYVITDANGCVSPNISGSFNCNCATNAGQMNLQPLATCEGGSVTTIHLGGENLDANDTISYILHTSSGTSLGTVLDQNTSGVFSFLPGMTFGNTYYVSLVAGNNLNGLPDPADPCFSVAQGQPVVFLQNPTPNAGIADVICGQTIDLQAVNSSFPGSWSFVSGPGTASFNIDSDPSTAVTVTSFGNYVFRWTETNSTCSSSDDVSIDFLESPAVNAINELCNGTNTQYTVSFTAAGGVAPYQVAGLSGSFSGNTFTSNQIANNTTYSFTVTDANGCISPTVTGIENCNCATDAGSMLNSPLIFCADVPATATWNNDANLDTDDILQFILHNQSGSTVGTVYATNSQPTFTFGAGLQTGVTYYISAIAGNTLSGSLDINDPCLSVSPGTPVQWKPLPDATISGDATICNGSSTPLIFGGTGVYPLAITYSNGSANTNTFIIANQQTASLTVTPTLSTTYTLLSVSDGTNPTCSSPLSESVTVTVNQPVTAGLANEPLELCAGTALPVQLVNLLNGADFGGQWSEVSVAPSSPGAFNPNTGTFNTGGQAAGTYLFRYFMPASAPCPNDEETVSVVLQALPVADAGEDKVINCNQVAVSLGGPGTSSGLGYTYDWSVNGASTGNTPDIFTAIAGDYTLLVTSSAGCTSIDAATVVLDNELPVGEIITVNDVRCFGDKNGKISVDSVTSTHQPLLFALNGGPFSSQSVFYPLEPGNYTVSILDANGCEWTSDTMLVDQPPQLIIELGATVQAALGDSVYLEAIVSVALNALDTITWNPLLDTARAGTNMQHFLPLESKEIRVHVVDTNGCSTNDRVLVIVDQMRNVFIPNIIKPGSDFNDKVVVFGGRDVDNIESFQIFDRWGEKIFETLDFKPNDPSKGWDGKFKGAQAAPGVYVYYAVVRFIDGEKIVFKGDVTVFR